MSTSTNGSENECANCGSPVTDEYSEMCDRCMGEAYGDMP